GLVLLATYYSLPTSSQNSPTADSNGIKKVLDTTYIHLLSWPMLSSQSAHSNSRSPNPHANFSLSFLHSANSALKTTPPRTTHLTAERTVSPNSPQLRLANAKTRKRDGIQTQYFHTIINTYSHNSCIFIPLQIGGECFSGKPAKHFDRACAYMQETPQTLSSHARTHSCVAQGGYGEYRPLPYSPLTIHYPLILLAIYSRLFAETGNDR